MQSKTHNAGRKIPMRKCTGCNEMKPKREMVRAVKNKEGEISLDLTGKKAGRGAYICKNLACLQAARKNRGLERAFSCRIPDEVYETMEKELTDEG
jgi:predicted RNA-binding protein YlxR (DUF448 family)